MMAVDFITREAEKLFTSFTEKRCIDEYRECWNIVNDFEQRHPGFTNLKCDLNKAEEITDIVCGLFSVDIPVLSFGDWSNKSFAACCAMVEGTYYIVFINNEIIIYHFLHELAHIISNKIDKELWMEHSGIFLNILRFLYHFYMAFLGDQNGH